MLNKHTNTQANTNIFQTHTHFLRVYLISAFLALTNLQNKTKNKKKIIKKGYKLKGNRDRKTEQRRKKERERQRESEK